jgi:hypothetical protein
MLTLAASICVGYSKAPGLAPVEVSVTNPKNNQTITVLGIPPKDIQHFMV